MGILLSRFRKKKSTIEILEDIDKDITRLRKLCQQNQERQKKLITRLILYSIVIYIISVLVIYFYYWPQTWKDGFIYSFPMFVFPILIWLIKKVLHWYFIKRIAKSNVALAELKEKKQKILEEVTETETYKKAKEILQKFDPERFKELETPAKPKPVTPPNSDVRQRINAAMAKTNTATPRPQGSAMRPLTPFPKAGAPRPYSTPHLPRGGGSGMQPRQLVTPQYNANAIYGQPPGPPLPRPVFERERSKMDRMLEYLLGDGPQNRYALICKSCHSHNGMALKEEFEYLSFRCCYCYHMNQAKKQRPFAPKLDTPAKFVPKEKVPGVASKEGIEEEEETEESDTESDEDADVEEDPITEEPKSQPSAISNMTQDTHVSTTSFTEDGPTENPNTEAAETKEEVPMETSITEEKDNIVEGDFQYIESRELSTDAKKNQ